MRQYLKQLAVFQSGVMNHDRAEAEKLIRPVRHNAFTPAMRLAVYANAYKIRLIEATEVDYLALKHHLGEEAYNKAVEAFVLARPSGLWDLNRYPISFADFIESHTDDGFAHAITRLEATITDVYWMPESTPLAPDYLSSQPPEQFAEVVLRQRDASELLEFAYPVNSYLIAFRGEENPKAPPSQKTYLYIYRHNDKVMREELSQAEYLLLQLLFDGKPLGAALEELTTRRPDLAEPVGAKLSGWFQRWFEQGFFAD